MIKRVSHLVLIATICFVHHLHAQTSGRQATFSYEITHFTEEEGFPQCLVKNIIQDSIGYIWIASWDGLMRYDGYRFKTYKARQGDSCPLETNRIDNLRAMADGRLLCKSKGRLYTFSPRTGEFSPATEGEILPFTSYKVDRATIDIVKSHIDYRDIETRVLFVDRQGGIWIASYRGLDRLSPAKKRHSPIVYGSQREEVVRALFQDSHHRIWMADKHGYVRILTPEQKGDPLYLTPAGTLSVTPTCFGKKVYVITEDSNGVLWMGCKPGGLYRLTPRGGSRFDMEHYIPRADDPYSLSNENIYSIIEDHHGNLWVGTFGGGIDRLTTTTDGKIRFIHSGNHLKNYPAAASFVYELYAHSQGTLFIGTNNGLYTCPTDPTIPPEQLTFETYKRESQEPKSLSSNWITDMIADEQENLYIATHGGGLNYLDVSAMKEGEAAFTAYTTEDGLISDIIVALTRTPGGELWCASGAALSSLDPLTGISTHYTQGDFSERFSFAEAGLLCLADCTLMAGTTQGVLFFPPHEIGKSDFVPRIALDCPDTITLSPTDKTLELSFAALDYNKHVPIHYAYKAGNETEGWSYTSDHKIHLSNIPAGWTTLYVRSTNGDGVWVDNVRTITLHRTPRFNERPVAWMLYGGLLLITIGLLFKVVRYISRLRKELHDIRLTTGETIEYLTTRLQESLTERSEKVPVTPEVVVPMGNDAQFRELVETYISAHLGDANLDIKDFARQIGVSRSVLYLQMKRIFGCTPNSYLYDARIAYARKMLDAGHSNISEVAYLCGYSDPKYFSRCFKKTVGMTPSDYFKREKT